jgi:hypothetical protein
MQILSAPFAGAIAGSYESIATTTVGVGGTSTITFSSIPSTFKHLQIRAIGRTANAVTADQAKLQMNSDTSTSSYAFHQLIGDGASATAAGYGSGIVAGIVPVIRFTGASATASIFGVTVFDILDYTSTAKYKTVRCLTGYDSNGSGQMQLTSGVWLSTSAVTSLDITMQGSGNFVQYSSFALYGIKG